MKTEEGSPFRHSHIFDEGNPGGEKGTRLVLVITLITMVVEVLAGWWFNSMALLADGWHMSSHAVAIGLSALAYAMARRYSNDPRFAFGTWKIEILGAFASALFMVGISIFMVVESVERLFHPRSIAYREAMLVAALGLIVNLLCAFILKDHHGANHHHHHDHHHDHDHGHEHADHPECAVSIHPAQPPAHHHDLNLRSAYIHVLADAATSVVAILALAGGWIWGWAWLDPVIGMAGALLIAIWAKGILRDAGRVLLDCEMDHPVVEDVRRRLESHPDWGKAIEITDLHLWRAGKSSYVCILSLATPLELSPGDIREALKEHSELAHITVEIERTAATQAFVRQPEP